ncbi:fructose-bisphosphate aldolase class II/tagatose 1,6-diphosphate aldolase GatY/KbaY [Kribbella sp. VKM Ac-2527]|uniref:Fructose-bisphosphate aldolase class II/tagatose 1,6-diphosphate aldolase GatY/KbaY n=1 Tax=Kribbella caucasensis TaxID=2512215 RepID=A0A4R6KHY8_9ACTN|nr:class II fructose-bisphosphate aldolase [Kribbella sp. VKM Ac-2527]TDO50519.1 fructose-bisphosphate aldolase class II/tagatose 1,6-diphosphate aldolase GatY/KbaY [Kribbella sp. VKM Ac-2527]
MRANFTELLEPAPHRFVAFTCYTQEQANAVIEEAEAQGSPVCLLLAEAALAARRGPLLLRYLVDSAVTAAVPVAVQLDHSTNLESIRAALDLGATAVMADGSRMSFEDNVALTAAALARAASYEASVEAELGQIPGDEDAAAVTAAAQKTSVATTRRFLQEVRPDVLAVAVGNVHGVYEHPPKLDFGRLRELSALDVALSLHGTSGLPDDQVADALCLGAVKFNVNTELRRAYFIAASDIFSASTRWNLLRAGDQLIAATRRAVQPYLALLHDSHGGTTAQSTDEGSA